MKRKVIKQGNGTLTITLPKGWTDKVGLTGDSEVDVEASGRGLVVKTAGTKSYKSIDIELESNNQRYIEQILNNLYLSGYDEAHISLFNPACLVNISRTIENLMGYQIIEQSDKNCLIKNLSPVAEEEFDSLLRRIFLLLKSMFSFLLDDLSKNTVDNLESVKATSKNITKFAYYCRRIIIKKPLFNDYESTRIYILITRLNTCSHSIIYLYDNLVKENRLNIDRETLEFSRKTSDYFLLFYELYYSRKLKDLPKISTLHDEMINEMMPSLLRKNKNPIIIHYMAQIVRDIARNGGILFTLKEEKGADKG